MRRNLAMLAILSSILLMACQDFSLEKIVPLGKKRQKKSAEETMETIFKIEDKITAFGKRWDRKSAEKLIPTVSKNKFEEGFFEDDRDGTVYRTVQIGTQVWMAENLNYEQGEASCYENDSANCKMYGRLYSWDEAEEACPSGWHLPQVSEVETLLKNAGGVQDDEKKFLWHNAGYFLKTKTGWQDYDEGVSGNGFDVLGFSAKAAGRYNNDFLGFYYLNVGAWFSVSRKNSPCHFNMLLLGFDSGDATVFCQNENSRKDGGAGNMDYARCSVRCVKD